MTDAGCSDLKGAGFDGVIVQAITGNDGKSYTRQQLEAAQRNGLRIMGYVWCFPNTLVGGMYSRLAMFQGYDIEKLWLDVEQRGLLRVDLDRDLEACDSFTGQRTGIYTARGVYNSMSFAGSTRWSDRDLWDANWDGVPDPAIGFVPYGGWRSCVIKQYGGENAVGRVHGIDLNAMR